MVYGNVDRTSDMNSALEHKARTDLGISPVARKEALVRAKEKAELGRSMKLQNRHDLTNDRVDQLKVA